MIKIVNPVLFHLVILSSELYLVLPWINSILGTKKPISCIVDCDWRESRLPWLDSVLICLVRVWTEVECLWQSLWRFELFEYTSPFIVSLQRVSQPRTWLMHGSVYLASKPIHPNVLQCYNSRGVVYQIVFLPIQVDQLLSTHSWNTALQDSFYNFTALYMRLHSTLRCTLQYTLLYFMLHKKGDSNRKT